MKGNDDETPQGNNSEKSIDPAASKTSAEGLSRRQMLSFGQPIVFNGSEPEDEREVLAEWLVEAMRTGRTRFLSLNIQAAGRPLWDLFHSGSTVR